MNVSLSVEKALVYASPLNYVGGEWVSDEATLAQIDVPTKGEHDYPVIIPARDELRLPDSYVTADNISQLEEVVFEYHRQIGVDPNLSLIQDELAHELQHRKAAEMMGANSCFYTLQISKNEHAQANGWILGNVPAGWKTTKARFAAAVAHPDVLSRGDERQLEALGYKSVAEIHEVAITRRLPSPLSMRTE